MKGLVRGKPQHLKEGLGAGGDLPGGLNRHLGIIPANMGECSGRWGGAAVGSGDFLGIIACMLLLDSSARPPVISIRDYLCEQSSIALHDYMVLEAPHR